MEPRENVQLTAGTCASRKRYKMYLRQGGAFLCAPVVSSLFLSKPLHNVKFRHSMLAKKVKLACVLRNLGNNVKQRH